MAEQLDVVVVGGRCAGAPLAALLARRGLAVALVEQAELPRGTLSSHVFEADALAFLDRLGATKRLRATGAPFANHVDLRVEDLHLPAAAWPLRAGDVGGLASIRREVLDPILVEVAEEAGATVHTGTKVTGLVEESGRVAGVRAGDRELRARLVVGADGRGSTVAELCGARKYNVFPNERGLYWAYFEGAAPAPDPTFVSHRWDDRFILGLESDAGLYQVIVWPELAEVERFKGDLEGLFMDQARSCEPIARALDGARRVGKIVGAVRWLGYFREVSGPGWVLAGDAGHFKDPAPGRGIGDAFIQAEALAAAIPGGLERPDAELDQAMRSWGRWRDEEFAEHYWLACDLGRTGTVPAVLPEIFRGLVERGRVDDFLDLLNHRKKPSEVLTPPRLLRATGRLLARRGDRLTSVREVAALAGDDMRRRRLNRRPAYV